MVKIAFVSLIVLMGSFVLLVGFLILIVTVSLRA